MFPNLFLLASPRSGSTQLAAWLASHPDIYMPGIKEPNFFSNHEFPVEYVEKTHLNDISPSEFVRKGCRGVYQFAVFRDESEYKAMYSSCEAKYTLDASTTYLHSSLALKNISDSCPGAKVIVLLRQPEKRMISHYQLAIRTGRTKDSIAKELEFELAGDGLDCEKFLIKQSLYSEAVKCVNRNFSEEDVLYVCFEDMVKNPESTIKKVCDFLSIDHDLVALDVSERNQSLSPRFAYLNYIMNGSGVKTFLRRFVSRSIKRKIKKFYFREADAVKSVEYKHIVKGRFDDDVNETLQLLPFLREFWG